MPASKSHGASQPTISSYFQPSPQKSKPGKRSHTPIELDLTDSDNGSPVKKPKRTGASQISPSSPTVSSSRGAAGQWRFTPVSPDKPETNTVVSRLRTDAELATAKERHEVFKRKLLLENNPFLTKKHDPKPIEVEDTDTSGEESDQAFKELSFMFSNKSKGKGSSAPATQKPKPTPKATSVAGPSGQAYTPLENQVRFINN